jgi:hypothetical protein
METGMNNTQAQKMDRRHDRRQTNRVITVELEGQFYSTLDWSVGGFRIEGYEGDLKAGNIAAISIISDEGNETLEQAATASIVRIVHEDLELQQLAAQFDDLSSSAFNLLDELQII